MKKINYIAVIICALPLISGKLIYKGESWIGPKTVIRKEAPLNSGTVQRETPNVIKDLEKKPASSTSVAVPVKTEPSPPEKVLRSYPAVREKTNPYVTFDGQIFTDGKVPFSLKSTDDVSAGFTEFSLNGKDFQTYKEPIPVTEEGKNTLIYRSRDMLGNLEMAKKKEIFVDKTRPKITLSPHSRYAENLGKKYFSPGAEFKLEASDRESGVREIRYSIDSQSWEVFYADYLRIYKDGEHSVSAVSEDNVGNVSEQSTFFFSIDSTPPEVHLSYFPVMKFKEKDYCKLPVTFHVDAADYGAGVDNIQYKFQHTEWSLTDGDIKITETDRDELMIAVRARDKVGNTSSVKAFKCLIDRTPPKTEFGAESAEKAKTSGEGK